MQQTFLLKEWILLKRKTFSFHHFKPTMSVLDFVLNLRLSISTICWTFWSGVSDSVQSKLQKFYLTLLRCKKIKMNFLHPEKYFVESTKIWLAQQCFSFKYGSMEILFELTTKILLLFFTIPTKKFCIFCKKMELQIKITK